MAEGNIDDFMMGEDLKVGNSILPAVRAERIYERTEKKLKGLYGGGIAYHKACVAASDYIDEACDAESPEPNWRIIMAQAIIAALQTYIPEDHRGD